MVFTLVAHNTDTCENGSAKPFRQVPLAGDGRHSALISTSSYSDEKHSPATVTPDPPPRLEQSAGDAPRRSSPVPGGRSPAAPFFASAAVLTATRSAGQPGFSLRHPYPMPPPLIVAARGTTESAPENTLAAFAAAIEYGADTIEFDVHPTRDGKLVVHHDYYLERTTDGSGPLANFTLDQLQRLDAGSWFGREFHNERIPTLNQVLELGRHRVRFEIDLRGTTLPFLRAVLSEIARFDLDHRVELTSPHIPLLCRIPAENTAIASGLFVESPPAWQDSTLTTQHVIDWLILASARVAHLPPALVQPAVVERIHAAGFLAHGSKLETAAEIAAGQNAGLDQFSTGHLTLAHSLRN